jgi:hypothetical protein
LSVEPGDCFILELGVRFIKLEVLFAVEVSVGLIVCFIVEPGVEFVDSLRDPDSSIPFELFGKFFKLPLLPIDDFFRCKDIGSSSSV